MCIVWRDGSCLKCSLRSIGMERERESQNQQRRLTDAVLSLSIIGLSPVATHHAQLSRTLSRCFCPEKIKGGDAISITQQH